MSRKLLPALTAALNALMSAGLTFALCVIPLSVMWFLQNLIEVSWFSYWRAAGGIWLLAHGVPFVVQDAAAARIPASSQLDEFSVSIAPLGLVVIVTILAFRTGRRFAFDEQLWPSWLASFVAYSGVSVVIALLTAGNGFGGSLDHAIVVPGLIYGGSFLAGSLLVRDAERLQRRLGFEDDQAASAEMPMERVWLNEQWGWLRSRADLVAETVKTVLFTTLLAVVAYLGVSAIVLGVVLGIGWNDVVTLYQQLHTDLTGSIVLTFGQLVYLPNLVIWVASWLTGAGFELGTGSLVSPLGTQVGPLPAIPVFGALPPTNLAWGFIGLLAPVLVIAGVLLLQQRRITALVDAATNRWAQVASIAALFAFGFASAVTLLSLWAGGSLGPGRMAELGPSPLPVFLWCLGIALVSSLLTVSVSVFAVQDETDLEPVG